MQNSPKCWRKRRNIRRKIFAFPLSHHLQSSSAAISYKYAAYDGNWLPIVFMIFGHGQKRLPVTDALVDTGATHTVLPLEMASELGIAIDVTDQVETHIAGGGQCYVHSPPVMIDCFLQDPRSRKTCHWKSRVLFALGQKIVLLGHHQCLRRFDVTFKGPEKTLEILPRLESR